MPLEQVEYDVLDRAKLAFIEAGRSTLSFAAEFGFVPGERLGSSANIFALNLEPFLKTQAKELYVTMLPEWLGTADDARPDDLSAKELEFFWRNIGVKTVAVMTNDAASSGVQTILVALYLPSSTPELVFDEPFLNGFLGGFVDGCRAVKCVYFSGETPQLKTKIIEGRLDIAGALFGIVPAGMSPVRSDAIRAGDTIVLVESSGPHENGFTTLRRLAEKLPDGYRTRLPSGEEYWSAINRASKLYTPYVQALLKAGLAPSNVENITGHGWQKLMRSRRPLRYVISEMLPVPEVFKFVEEHSGTPPERMVEIFNYGAGLAVYLPDLGQATRAVQIASGQGLRAVVAGRIEAAANRQVVIEPLKTVLSGSTFLLNK